MTTLMQSLLSLRKYLLKKRFFVSFLHLCTLSLFTYLILLIFINRKSTRELPNSRYFVTSFRKMFLFQNVTSFRISR